MTVTFDVAGHAKQVHHAVEAKALANLFLDWAGEDQVTITPLKMQKMLFFCHADYLVQYGDVLIKQDFEAWDYGPVVPSIYKEFKTFERRPIKARALLFNAATGVRHMAVCTLNAEALHRVRALFDFYKHVEAERLSNISHAPGGAWRQARSLFSNGLNADRRIGVDLIRRHHKLPQI